MFVFFLDFLLSVSVKFLFLCVCVCVCVSVCPSDTKKLNKYSYNFPTICIVIRDTHFCCDSNSPPLNWVSFIIFEKVPIKKPSSWWWWWGPKNTLFRSSSSTVFLSLQFSVFVERMSGNCFYGLLGHDYIFLLICHKENTSIVAIWVLIRTHKCESNAKQAGEERKKCTAQPKIGAMTIFLHSHLWGTITKSFITVIISASKS